jgi:hypothetical protein
VPVPVPPPPPPPAAPTCTTLNSLGLPIDPLLPLCP